MIAKTRPAAAADFDRLDAELARWLRTRSTLRAARHRAESALDGVAMALRKLRATLSFAAASASSSDGPVLALVSRIYRWSIRVARELEALEKLALEPMAEWTRFEAFAPFALAFFDSLLGAPLSSAAGDVTVARIRGDLDGVLSPFLTAMTSSAMAA